MRRTRKFALPTLPPRWAFWAVLAVAAALYASLWSAPGLTWDDDSNIFGNPFYHARLWWPFWTMPYFGLYVPVTSTIWEILYRLSDGAAWPYRLLNTSLHVVNITLVYMLLGRLARRWRMNSGWPPVLGAALFAFHPLQVETVAWISGGRDLLAAFWALMAVWLYFREGGSRDGRSRVAYLAATVCFGLSLLSKPSAAALPAVFPLMEVVLRTRTGFRRACMKMIPWLILTAAATAMTLSAQAEHLTAVDWWLRPWLALDTYTFYILKTVWPWPLAVNYARTPAYVLNHLPTLGWGLAGGALLAAALTAAWRRKARAAFLAAWVLLLVPVSGLVPFAFQEVSGTADHYLYLPMAVVSVLLMAALDHFAAPSRATMTRAKPIVWSATVLMICVWGAASWFRIGVWRSDETLFTDMAAHAPEAYSTAIGMSGVMCRDRKDYAAGVKWTDVALKAQPLDIRALANRAYCYFHGGQHGHVEELKRDLVRLDRAELERRQPTAYSSLLASLGKAEIELKHYEEGFQFICEAYRVMPSEPNHLGNLNVAAQILRRQGITPVCRPGRL